MDFSNRFGRGGPQVDQGLIALAACRGRRVALIDTGENPLYRPFSEDQARRRGYELRYFSDMAAAMAWLDADAH